MIDPETDYPDDYSELREQVQYGRGFIEDRLEDLFGIGIRRPHHKFLNAVRYRLLPAKIPVPTIRRPFELAVPAIDQVFDRRRA